MDAQLISFSGLVLMFVLGLRHGLDPDHIACIDGLTWRALDQRRDSTAGQSHDASLHQPAAATQHLHAGDAAALAVHAPAHVHVQPHHHGDLAPWVGTLFALGHGLLVTAIAVGVNQIARGIEVPETAVTVFGWIPTLLLLLVGTLNLRQLRSRSALYAPTGWKMRLVPRRLRENSSPFAIVAIGVLFATVFDTATQASAWGYVATSNGGILAAAGAGLIFTAGMIITDTLDGRLLCHIVRRADGEAAGRRYRRTLGWLIVALSFGVAAYNIGKSLVPQMELDERGYSIVGASLLAIVLVMWAWTYRSRPRGAGAAAGASLPRA
ncbi:MAG: nickel permease [Rhizobacter sp.]|nr:nickel permease [Rhizobacter sp.]